MYGKRYYFKCNIPYSFFKISILLITYVSLFTLRGAEFEGSDDAEGSLLNYRQRI
ncbi:hypothetical protein GCM10008904_28300 [Paraclostridium ghonii]